MTKVIGILAIQGAFIEHKNMLDSIKNVKTKLVKNKKPSENTKSLKLEKIITQDNNKKPKYKKAPEILCNIDKTEEI